MTWRLIERGDDGFEIVGNDDLIAAVVTGGPAKSMRAKAANYARQGPRELDRYLDGVVDALFHVARGGGPRVVTSSPAVPPAMAGETSEPRPSAPITAGPRVTTNSPAVPPAMAGGNAANGPPAPRDDPRARKPMAPAEDVAPPAPDVARAPNLGCMWCEGTPSRRWFCGAKKLTGGSLCEAHSARLDALQAGAA